MQGIMENMNQQYLHDEYEHEKYLWEQAGMPILTFEEWLKK